MAKKAETIFERAEGAVQSGTAANCRGLIAELEQLQAEEGPMLDAVRPPGQQVHGPDGRVYGILPAGPKFEQACTADDALAIQECHEEFARLTARLDRAALLRAQLKKRQATAQADEAVAAAPTQAKQAIAALDELLDRHAAVIDEFAAVHGKLKANIDSLLAARRLDPDVPTLSLEQFYRCGVALAYLPPMRRQETEGGLSEPARTTQPLFGHSLSASNNAKALIDVPRSVWDRTRELLGLRPTSGVGLDSSWRPDTSDRAVRDRLNDWYDELVRLLGAGDVDRAKKLGPPKMKHGRPVFDDQAA